MDRFRDIILRQRLLFYPEGRDIYGVAFEYETKHKDKEDVSN